MRLSAEDVAALDRATAAGQQGGALASLSVFDVDGRRVYPRVGAASRCPIEPQVLEALRGRDVVHRLPTEIDPTTGKATGALDAFKTLRSADGTTIGVLETTLRLEPIVADSARIQKRIVLFLLVGATILWFFLDAAHDPCLMRRRDNVDAGPPPADSRLPARTR